MDKREWKIGWKVIREDRQSCTASARFFPALYLKNKITERNPDQLYCGPFAVFETRQAAREFKYDYEDKYIWPYNNNIRDRKYGWKIVRCEYIQSDACSLWEDPCNRQRRVPDRTIFADKVKCLE
jgi:DNA modification methylase